MLKTMFRNVLLIAAFLFSMLTLEAAAAGKQKANSRPRVAVIQKDGKKFQRRCFTDKDKNGTSNLPVPAVRWQATVPEDVWHLSRKQQTVPDTLFCAHQNHADHPVCVIFLSDPLKMVFRFRKK